MHVHWVQIYIFICTCSFYLTLIFPLCVYIVSSLTAPLTLFWMHHYVCSFITSSTFDTILNTSLNSSHVSTLYLNFYYCLYPIKSPVNSRYAMYILILILSVANFSIDLDVIHSNHQLPYFYEQNVLILELILKCTDFRTWCCKTPCS